ncbi:MAG: HAD family hydrolase [Prochloraceae cyanobacterium]|nr:HAD family hydrolase [Prochloraceae cyanobacterium]
MTKSTLLVKPTADKNIQNIFNLANLQEKATLFCDFDGPIVDVSDRYYRTYKICLQKMKRSAFGSKALSKKQFWQMKQHRISDIKIAKRSGLKSEQIDPFLQEVRTIVNHPDLLEADRIQPGVKWALGMLRSQGVRLVLVTLRCQSQVKEILKQSGLESLFSGVYGRRDIHSAYQNNAELKTELLKNALRDRAHNSCNYMVGDTEADIIAAKETGINSIALSCGIRSSRYLSKYQPDYICKDLLSTAHHLLDSAKL